MSMNTWFIRFFSLVLIVSLMASLTAFASEIDCEQYKNPKTRQAVELVYEAADLLKTKGKSAFKEFSTKGSRWFNGDRYIFVHAMDGKLLCNGAFPSMVGSNMIDFRGVAGKPIVRFMIDEVTLYGRDNGWVHYLWPKPGEIEPSWKSTFVHLVKGPDGQRYIVGMGLYEVPMERCFAVEQVEEAAWYVERRGAKVFDLFHSKDGPFLWKNSYVFIIGMDGIGYVNPINRSLEGKDVKDLMDERGFKFVQKMQEVLREKEAGWVEYMWPKPGFIAAYKKHTYTKLVRSGGKEYMIGCGIYLD